MEETDAVTIVVSHDTFASNVIGTGETADLGIEDKSVVNDDVIDDHVAVMTKSIDADDDEHSSTADDVLASDLSDVAAAKRVDDDDTLNCHVWDEDTLLAGAVAATVDSSLKKTPSDVIDEDDDTLTRSINHEINIADHVLICDSGAAGLSLVCLGNESCDTAADYSKADETLVADMLDKRSKFTLKQKALTDINHLTESYRDNGPGCVISLEYACESPGPQVLSFRSSSEMAQGIGIAGVVAILRATSF